MEMEFKVLYSIMFGVASHLELNLEIFKKMWLQYCFSLWNGKNVKEHIQAACDSTKIV